MPSISPGFWPLSFRACCTFFTSSLPAALLAEWLVDDVSDERLVEDMSEEDDPDEEDMPVSLDALPDLPLWLVRLLPAEPVVAP